MRESERTVYETAISRTARDRQVCSQLVSDRARYSRWFALHAHRMRLVGRLLRRNSQILELRRACVEQLHRAALVRYFREFEVSGPERDRTLRLFYGVTDAREATLLEHDSYLSAVSSQLCASRLLALAGDTRGVELIRRYEAAYTQYFGLFCERARRNEAGQQCLLGELLPEVKITAVHLRERIMGGDLLPGHTKRTERRPPRAAQRPPDLWEQKVPIASAL